MPAPSRLFLLGVIAMLAFAANSILARMALVDGGAGAMTFSLIRLLSGALVLACLIGFRLRGAGSWRGGACLLLYVMGFSFAYLQLGAGLGALILFASVQFTMVGWALRSGERLTALQWAGLVIAFAALVWLLSPGTSGVSVFASAAMITAGIGWGAYSLLGRGARAPTRETAGNFARASLIALLFAPALFLLNPEPAPTQLGILAALASGIFASGLGYAIWYAALPGLGRAQAGILQLSVPALAAIGGVIFLSEPISLRLTLSTLIILSGVGLATLANRKPGLPKPHSSL